MPFLTDINVGSLNNEDPKKQIESIVAQLNEWGRSISNEDRTLIKKDDSGTPRVLLGQGPNEFHGLKVSQEGENVLTASDDGLIFNSDRNLFKIVDSNTFSLAALDAAGGANDNVTTVFDTGYESDVPLAYVAYVVNDSGGYNQLPQLSLNYSGSLQIYRTVAVELSGGTVQLRVYSQNYTGSPRVETTCKYYLFSESVT